MGRNKDKFKQISAQKQARKKDRDIKKNLRKKMHSGDGFKLSKEYIRYYQEFDQEILRLGIKLKDVGGDGNCLFRAIADQVDGNEASHVIMREQACKFIIANQQFFTNFLDEDEDGTIEQYVHSMRRNGEYGGHLELQALSECFRCVIVVHKRNLEQYYITPIINQLMGGSIIHLAYFQNQDFEHYLSIRPINDNLEQPAAQQLKTLNKNLYNHLIINEEQQEMAMMKQIEQLDFYQEAEILTEPYPNYPRNKKCKCGSKQAYKNCCFKAYQKKLAKKQQSYY